MRTIPELLASPTPHCLEDAAWLTGYMVSRHIPRTTFHRILFGDTVRQTSRSVLGSSMDSRSDSHRAGLATHSGCCPSVGTGLCGFLGWIWVWP